MKSTKQAKTTLDGAITPAVFAFCWLFNNMYEKRSDVIRKNKVTDNLVKIELDMDQGSIKAFAQICFT